MGVTLVKRTWMHFGSNAGNKRTCAVGGGTATRSSAGDDTTKPRASVSVPTTCLTFINFFFFFQTQNVGNVSQIPSLSNPKTTDMKTVVFQCPRFGRQFHIPICFPAVKQGSNSGIKSWKEILSGWARCQKANGVIYFTRKWRAETLQPGLEFDIFKPRLRSGIFKCISWLNGPYFGGDDQSFLKEGVKTYQMAPISPLNSPNFFLSSHL
jgi:hypothetical protein